jgi:hypothetical protein
MYISIIRIQDDVISLKPYQKNTFLGGICKYENVCDKEKRASMLRLLFLYDA